MTPVRMALLCSTRHAAASGYSGRYSATLCETRPAPSDNRSPVTAAVRLRSRGGGGAALATAALSGEPGSRHLSVEVTRGRSRGVSIDYFEAQRQLTVQKPGGQGVVIRVRDDGRYEHDSIIYRGNGDGFRDLAMAVQSDLGVHRLDEALAAAGFVALRAVWEHAEDPEPKLAPIRLALDTYLSARQGMDLEIRVEDTTAGPARSTERPR